MKRHTLVHSKDKKYVCKVCNRVFMSAASVGIKHGSRRHGVCMDCAGRGMARGGHSPDGVYSGETHYIEDVDELKVDEDMGGEEDDDIKWKDEAETSQDDVILEDDEIEECTPEVSRGPMKEFTWIA